MSENNERYSTILKWFLIIIIIAIVTLAIYLITLKVILGDNDGLDENDKIPTETEVVEFNYNR